MKPGDRLRSAVCTTEVVVVKAPAEERCLACGGAPMGTAGSHDPASAALDGQDAGSGTLLGKRYVDEQGDIEVLCVKGGGGSLTLDGVPLVVKDAKPLPSSD